MKHIFFALFSVWPLSASAAVSYSRTPTGNVVSNPVTVTFSFDNFLQDFGASDKNFGITNPAGLRKFKMKNDEQTAK